MENNPSSSSPHRLPGTLVPATGQHGPGQGFVNVLASREGTSRAEPRGAWGGPGGAVVIWGTALRLWLSVCLSVCLSPHSRSLPRSAVWMSVCRGPSLLLARPLPRPDPGSDIPARLGGDGAPGLPRPEIQEDLTAIKTSRCGRDSQAGQAGGRLPGTDTRVPGVPAERERGHSMT